MNEEMHQVIAVARMAASLILSNGGETYRAEETAVHIGRTFGCEIGVIALSRGVQTVLIAVVAVFFRAQIAPKPLSLKNSLFGRGVFIARLSTLDLIVRMFRAVYCQKALYKCVVIQSGVCGIYSIDFLHLARRERFPGI